MFFPRKRRPGRTEDGRVEPRPHPQRSHRTSAAVVTTLVLFAFAAHVEAVPLDEPNIGGIGFSGPTTGDLAATYWNPAALGLMHGLQLTFAGTTSYATTTVRRAPVGEMAFPQAQSQVFTQPFVLSKDPGLGTQSATGPGDSMLSYSIYLFQNGFVFLKMGYASAMAWTLLLVTLLITLLILWSARKWVHYDSR